MEGPRLTTILACLFKCTGFAQRLRETLIDTDITYRDKGREGGAWSKRQRSLRKVEISREVEGLRNRKRKKEEVIEEE